MAKIKVNKEIWEDISSEDQKDIKKVLVDAGSIKITDEIIGDSSIKPAPEEGAMDKGINISDACTSGCEAAYDAAKLACNLHWSSRRRRACRNVAYHAYQICLEACRS